MIGDKLNFPHWNTVSKVFTIIFYFSSDSLDMSTVLLDLAYCRMLRLRTNVRLEAVEAWNLVLILDILSLREIFDTLTCIDVVDTTQWRLITEVFP